MQRNVLQTSVPTHISEHKKQPSSNVSVNGPISAGESCEMLSYSAL